MDCLSELSQARRRSCLVRSNGERRSKRHVSFPIDLLLESAVRDGDVGETGRILANYDHEEVDIDALHSSGVCALHQSALQRNSAMTEMLLRHGACVDKRDVVGWTALHAAAAMSAVDCAKVLLSARADVYARTHDGDLPLDLVDASEEDGVQCVKFIVQAMQREHANEFVRHHQPSVMFMDETGSRASMTDSGIDIELDDLSLTGEVCVDFAEPSPLPSPIIGEATSLGDHRPPQLAPEGDSDSDVTSSSWVTPVTSEEEVYVFEQLMLSGMVAKLFRCSSQSSLSEGAAVSEVERHRIMVADLHNGAITYV